MHLLKCIVVALAVIGVGVMLLTIWTAKPTPPDPGERNGNG